MRRQVALSNVLHRVIHSPIAVSPEEFVDVRIYEKAEAAAFVKAFEPLVKNHPDKHSQLRFGGTIWSWRKRRLVVNSNSFLFHRISD